MKLLTKENLKDLAKQNGHEENPICYVKLFAPWGSWTWYLINYDPENKLAFALVEGFKVELGDVSLEELQGIRGAFGLKIERDIHWTPKPLSEVRNGIEKRRYQG